jgi:murein DD-endopeptidase MepM/ murein hydrolase activator NlpD
MSFRPDGLRMAVVPTALVTLALAGAVAVGCRNIPLPMEPSLTRQACLGRATFEPPASSPYCLPIPVGTSGHVSQSYCSPVGRSHHTKFAFDFDCEPGDPLVAARGGYVEMVGEEWSDADTTSGHENRVVIRHDDGSAAFYAHFQYDGVDVTAGDVVVAGQLLGRCGTSGTYEPHLHLQVAEALVYDQGQTLAVSFRNAQGPLDSRGGLAEGTTYSALACH